MKKITLISIVCSFLLADVGMNGYTRILPLFRLLVLRGNRENGQDTSHFQSFLMIVHQLFDC